MINQIKESIAYIKEQTNLSPKVGIVLGSGLGQFGDTIKNSVAIKYEDIPHFNSTAVAGHKGQLIIGNIGDTTCAVFQGRVHAYEGYSLDDVVYSARLLKFLGAENLILTNAAGGINSTFKPGQLVVIKDHINLTGKNPLIGKNNEDFGPRFPDMTFAYNKNLNEIIYSAAKEVNYEIKTGVYAAMMGPSYETPAEINMLRTLGADMVGMSTVFESIAGNHLGLKVAGISCITNMAAGIENVKLKHEDIKDEANKSIEAFCEILNKTIEQL